MPTETSTPTDEERHPKPRPTEEPDSARSVREMVKGTLYMLDQYEVDEFGGRLYTEETSRAVPTPATPRYL